MQVHNGTGSIAPSIFTRIVCKKISSLRLKDPSSPSYAGQVTPAKITPAKITRAKLCSTGNSYLAVKCLAGPLSWPHYRRHIAGDKAAGNEKAETWPVEPAANKNTNWPTRWWTLR